METSKEIVFSEKAPPFSPHSSWCVFAVLVFTPLFPSYHYLKYPSVILRFQIHHQVLLCQQNRPEQAFLLKVVMAEKH